MADTKLRNGFVKEGKGEMAAVSGKAVADRGFSPIIKTKENVMVNARDYDMANKIALNKMQVSARQ